MSIAAKCIQILQQTRRAAREVPSSHPIRKSKHDTKTKTGNRQRV